MSCVAYGCTNRICEEIRERNISFHSFPKNDIIRQQWINAVNRKNWEPSKNSRLCSVHFLEGDFQLNCLKKTLKVRHLNY